MTKADLKDALAVAEVNLLTAAARVEELEAAVEERDSRYADLHEENLTRITHAVQLEDALRSTGAQVAKFNEEISLEREAAALIDEALTQDIETLFGHLRFAVATLAAIVAYNGDDADVVRKLALTAGEEMIDLTESGVVSGRYTHDGALTMAVAVAYETLAEVKAEDAEHAASPAACPCGGICGD